MELKRRFDFRKIVTILYIVAFSLYLLIGLQPAEATSYEINGGVIIPSINLVSGVTNLKLEDHKLNTPDTIVGSYSNAKNKTLLIGHSSTIFKNLHSIKNNDYIYYNDKTYKVTESEILEKSAVNMNKILAAADQDTLVIMTCAGDPVGEKDATHRLIVTAVSAT